MQGRLSPIVDGRIQAFPWASWKDEFPIAEEVGIHRMEWTLDQERLYENPLLTKVGQTQIKELCKRHSLTIPSLTGDCFMQAPLWKVKGEERAALERDFRAVIEGCAAVGIVMIVVPLVDNGRLENAEQEETLITFLESQTEYLISNGMNVVFESDFAPSELARFIGKSLRNGYQNKDGIIPPGQLRKMIAYARTINPELTDEVDALIEDYYEKIRVESKSRNHMTVTTRQLLSIYHMAEAYARVHLHQNVLKEDAQAAIDIFDLAFRNVNTD